MSAEICGVLVKAFRSVLTDEDFDLPTQPAKAARRGAQQFLACYSSGSRQGDIEAFTIELFGTVQSCFDNVKGKKERKEKIYEHFYQTRSTCEFTRKWEDFLKLCSVDASIPTLYQHITDKVFNHLLKVNHPIIPQEQATQAQLDYNEKNALRYVAGYVSRNIYHKLKQSNNPMKDELLLCLAELNDVDPDEMDDESKDWLKAVDRGALKHVTNMVYMVFVSIESELRKQLETCSDLTKINFKEEKEKVIQCEGVQFYWSIVACNWQEETATALLEMLIEDWMQIRGHSTASAWLEQYKMKKKISVQKSKGVRKQLLSKSSKMSKGDDH